jgi:SPP1 family predicted phage head-tail adaptor
MSRIGKLDQQIVIQNYTTTRTDSGAEVDTWTTLATVWAGVDFKAGNENFEADQKVANNIVKFKIRYLAGVLAKSRISYDSEYWDILHITGNSRLRYLELTAEKKNMTWQT